MITRNLVPSLVEYVEQDCSLPVLRTYWYDGAPDGIPADDHLDIARLPGVKLRLGRLIAGRQKGVDSLIVRDLMTLARERAVSTAYLLGGDEDLRVGVEAAQDMGVRVSVIGIENPRRQNQADTLIREADEHLLLSASYLRPFFQRAASPPPTPVVESHADLQGLVKGRAADFAREWVAKATDDEAARLLGQRPVIPKALDAELLRHVQSAAGQLDKRDDLRNLMRAAFWQEATAVQHAPSRPPERLS